MDENERDTDGGRKNHGMEKLARAADQNNYHAKYPGMKKTPKQHLRYWTTVKTTPSKPHPPPPPREQSEDFVSCRRDVKLFFKISLLVPLKHLSSTTVSCPTAVRPTAMPTLAQKKKKRLLH